MKITNFRSMVHTGTSPLNWEFSAVVDVTTGFLWWKKTKEREVSRKFCEFWFFTDNGKLTPTFAVEDMERGYKARNKLPVGWR
jgi:hypothetical protein